MSSRNPFFRTAMTLAVAGAIAVCAGMALSFASTDKKMAASNETIPNELLVKFAPNMTAGDIDQLNKSLGVEAFDVTKDGRLKRIRVPYAESLKEIRAAYERTPGVEYVEPHYKVGIEPVPESGDGKDKSPSVGIQVK